MLNGKNDVDKLTVVLQLNKINYNNKQAEDTN